MGPALSPRVVCTGIATVDEIFTMSTLPTIEGKYSAFGHVEIGGGVAANAAVAVARLGGDAAFIGCVGADALGDRLLGEFADFGVDTAGCQRIAGAPTPISAVLVDAAGRRTVVNHLAPGLFSSSDLSVAAAIGRADAVLVDCRWTEGAVATLAAARRAGVPGVVDVDRPLTESAADSIFGRASHLVFSRAGLEGTSGLADVAGGLTTIAERCGAWLAVTDGAKGVTWSENGQLCHQPALPVDAVDTTGAGDVFHGAFVLALAEGRSEREAVRFASVAAGVKCERGGGRAGIPDRATVDDALARLGVAA